MGKTIAQEHTKHMQSKYKVILEGEIRKDSIWEVVLQVSFRQSWAFRDLLGRRDSLQIRDIRTMDGRQHGTEATSEQELRSESPP